MENEKFIWHPLTRGDIPEVHALFYTVNCEEGTDYSETEEDLIRQFDDPWSNPATDARIIRTKDGNLSAFLRVWINPNPKDENYAFIRSVISPKNHAQLEERSLEWLETRAQQRFLEISNEEMSAFPSIIRTGMPVSAKKTIQIYNEHGFTHVRSFFKMQRNLKDPIPENALPSGLTLRTYNEELDEDLRKAVNESFADHWGHQKITAEEWHPFVMDVSEIRRDLTLIVMDGNEVAAFCINHVKKLKHKGSGLEQAVISMLGTRHAWRKRGIASALITESMRRFEAAGFDSIELTVDSSSLTGALVLYETLGFKTYKTIIHLEKRIE